MHRDDLSIKAFVSLDKKLIRKRKTFSKRIRLLQSERSEPATNGTIDELAPSAQQRVGAIDSEINEMVEEFDQDLAFRKSELTTMRESIAINLDPSNGASLPAPEGLPRPWIRRTLSYVRETWIYKAAGTTLRAAAWVFYSIMVLAFAFQFVTSRVWLPPENPELTSGRVVSGYIVQESESTASLLILNRHVISTIPVKDIWSEELCFDKESNMNTLANDWLGIANYYPDCE
jgi:hypothetical protein